MKNGEIDSIAGRVMGGPSSNSLGRLSQSTAAAGGISTVNSPEHRQALAFNERYLRTICICAFGLLPSPRFRYNFGTSKSEISGERIRKFARRKRPLQRLIRERTILRALEGTHSKAREAS